TIFTLPASSADSSSRTGAIARQGPHHSAQKSTRTGSLADRTSSPKVASETCLVIELPFGLESGGCVIQKLGRVQRSDNDPHLMVKDATAAANSSLGKNSSDSKEVQRMAARTGSLGKSWPATSA